MNTNTLSTIFRRLRATAACVATALAIGAPAPQAAAAVILDPALAGAYAEGTGSNATFLAIDGSWTGTEVYWSEALKQYSNAPGDGYVRIGTLGWGTGIWGLADWTAINTAGSAPIVHSWSGRVPLIDHADAEYLASTYPGSWGVVGALPTGFFDGSAPQDNWTSHYTGYIRITDPGAYNFGVLYDDGFFLRIWGADGAMYEISSDFLSPRERLGFDENFLLSTGLYRFELGAYDRLEVGVVNLAWLLDGRWVTIPTSHLVTDPVAIPAPGTIALLLAALGALALARMKRKRG
jgi:hypothetical protein